MRVIWNALGLYISRNLRMGRGVNVPRLGIFTFTPPEVRLKVLPPPPRELQMRKPETTSPATPSSSSKNNSSKESTSEQPSSTTRTSAMDSDHMQPLEPPARSPSPKWTSSKLPHTQTCPKMQHNWESTELWSTSGKSCLVYAYLLT